MAARAWGLATLTVCCALVVGTACVPPEPTYPVVGAWVEPGPDVVGHVEIPGELGRFLVATFPLGDGLGMLLSGQAVTESIPHAPANVVRVGADGSMSSAALDRSFSNGAEGIQLFASDQPVRRAVLADGRVAIALGPAVVMLNPDGTRDTTWGEDGWLDLVTDGVPASRQQVSDLSADPTGAIVATHQVDHVAPVGDAAWRTSTLHRFDSVGDVDMDFGEAGAVELPLSTYHNGLSDDPWSQSASARVHLAPGSDGTLVVASGGTEPWVHRFRPDGQADPDFRYSFIEDGGGFPSARPGVGRVPYLADVSVDSLGRVALYDIYGESARLLPDGAVDRSYGYQPVVPESVVPSPPVPTGIGFGGGGFLVSSPESPWLIAPHPWAGQDGFNGPCVSAVPLPENGAVPEPSTSWSAAWRPSGRYIYPLPVPGTNGVTTAGGHLYGVCEIDPRDRRLPPDPSPPADTGVLVVMRVADRLAVPPG